MRKLNFSWVLCSLFISLSAFGLNSYQVKIQIKFPDGKLEKETLAMTGTDWVEKKMGSNSVKLMVEPKGEQTVKTTVEIASGSKEKPIRSQFITKLTDRDFSTIESKNEKTGRAYEIKILVSSNALNDTEK